MRYLVTAVLMLCILSCAGGIKEPLGGDLTRQADDFPALHVLMPNAIDADIFGSAGTLQ
jgi:hypothetical protein